MWRAPPLYLYCKTFPHPFISAWVPHPSCEEIKLLGTRGQSSWEKARGKSSPPFWGLRLGTPVCIHLPFPHFIPTLKCRVQEFKTSL